MGQRKVLYMKVFTQLYFLLHFLFDEILLAKLKNLYIQYAWISIMIKKKQDSSQDVKVEEIMVFA